MDVFYGSVRDIATIGISWSACLKQKALDSSLTGAFPRTSKDPFLYRERPIRWGVKKTKYGTIYSKILSERVTGCCTAQKAGEE